MLVGIKGSGFRVGFKDPWGIVRVLEDWVWGLGFCNPLGPIKIMSSYEWYCGKSANEFLEESRSWGTWLGVFQGSIIGKFDRDMRVTCRV